ncbi:MAG: PD40 domain-containing protein [Ardenticatenaceae bacterium]|nr:PD40 domain-containing protein [Ardenticatenaceae bacterium]
MSRDTTAFAAVLIGLCLLFFVRPFPALDAQEGGQDAGIDQETAVSALAHGRLLPGAATPQTAVLADQEQTADYSPFISLEQAAAPDALPGSGSITFSSNRSGDFDLYRRQFPDAAAALLLHDSHDLATPSWSPDGRYLLYASNADGDFDIFLRGPDDNPLKLTQNTAEDIHPSWSPDGRRILFSSNRQGLYQVYSMDTAGGDVRQHGAIAGNHAIYPRYSPDGRRIAFMRASVVTPACDWNWDIWVMAEDGSDLRRITSQLGGDLYPNWSPDGQSIVYARCEYLFTSDLYAVNLDTGAETQLTNSFLSSEWNGVYASDGGYLAFNSDLTGDSDIYVVAGGGGAASNITAAAAEDLAPAWSGPVPDVCADASTAVQPLLLAPGWGAADLVSEDGSGFALMLPYLEAMGYRLGCNLFYAGDTDAGLTIYQNGRRILNDLCSAYSEVAAWNQGWNGHFDIAGHSYGGLRARAFLESPDMYDPLGIAGANCHNPALPPGDRLFVDNLYTLGSPHGGGSLDLPGALVIGLGHVLNPDEWGSIFELFDMEQFNALHTQPNNVCYWLVGGNAWAQQATHDLLGGFYSAAQKTTLPNDLGVYRSSASALYQNYAGRYPFAVPVETDDMHGYFWLLAGINSYVHPQDTFDAVLKPHLESPNSHMADCQSALTAYRSRPQTAVAETAAIPAVQLVAGEIVSGSVATGSFTLTEGGPVSVYLNAPAGDLSLHLAAPDGTLLTPATAAVLPGVGYETAGIMGQLAGYDIVSTVSGTWVYTLTANSVPFPMPYQITAVPEYPAAVQAKVSSYVPAGQTAVITGAVSLGTMPLQAAAVVAHVNSPDGSVQTLPLWDDGGHQDGTAGDAVYGGTFLPARGPGRYLVVVEAVGSSQGHDFRRTDSAVLTVYPPGAGLTQEFADAPRDDDGDGRYDWLDVRVGLTVTNTGSYRLDGELTTATGRMVAVAAVEAALSPGDQPVTLSFPAAHIALGRTDGPYRLSLRLSDVTAGTWQLAAAENVYETAPYSVEDFGWNQHVFLPVVVGKPE